MKAFSSPLSGICFLREVARDIDGGADGISFRPLFRGSVFYPRKSSRLSASTAHTCFRPLFRGFVFYVPCVWPISLSTRTVFVPSFGDLFFTIVADNTVVSFDYLVFVPSFGDLFFTGISEAGYTEALNVFVPSFGDLFFTRLFVFGESVSKYPRFRPLFRGSVFYIKNPSCRKAERKV